MSMQLNRNDGQAIDLLLEHGADSAGLQAGKIFASVADSDIQKRVSAVESIFKLLQQMPTEEPPTDLVARTMGRIDEFESQMLSLDDEAVSAESGIFPGL